MRGPLVSNQCKQTAEVELLLNLDCVTVMQVNPFTMMISEMIILTCFPLHIP